MRTAIGIFIAALVSAPAMAAEVARDDLTRWVSYKTDISPSQVAIAGPDSIYSVEKLGTPAPTGEVIALVRAENLKASWAGPQGFASWDAHIIFDCKLDRMRVIRSASYPEANRDGEPRSDARLGDWFIPRPEEPSDRLMAAACDAAYPWPLRAAPRTIAKTSAPPIIEEAPPRSPAPEATPGPTEAAPAADDAGAAAKPAFALASQPVGSPMVPPSVEALAPAALAASEILQAPRLALVAGAEKRPAATAAPRLRLAGLWSPFAKVASAGKRLFADGKRLADAEQRRPAERHAALGEQAAKKVANFARAGPGLE